MNGFQGLRIGFSRYYGPPAVETTQGVSDSVKQPKHYEILPDVETLDVIKALVPDFVSYCEGNAIKYLTRWRKKGGVEDLRKCKMYLEWMIEEEE